MQLYDLSTDLAETRNLAAEQPAKVKELTALLEDMVQRGRSTPGMILSNAVEVQILKGSSKAAKSPKAKQ